MKFEWNPIKNNINIDKHGIDFNHVCLMFNNPMLTLQDKRMDYEEERWLGIGWLKSLLVVVVYAERKETIRIISARKATKNERRLYEKYFKH